MKKAWKPNSLTGQEIIEQIQEGIIISDAKGIILQVNPTFTRVTGYKPEEAIGQPTSLLKSGKHTKAFYKKMWTMLEATGTWQGEICNKKKDGSFYTEWLTITTIKDKKARSQQYLAVFNDITKRKKAEDAIKHLAYYDSLTDLPNRTLFSDRLSHDLAHASRANKLLAVLFLDLDRVKLINDTLGHAVGDELLKGVAGRLKKSLREGDTVARMGGDEFMIILPDIEQAETITIIAAKILQSLKPPFKIHKEELYITGSLGISIFPFDGKDPDTLIKNADTAMYRAKNAGRNNYQVFTPSMKQEVMEQLAMGNNLRRALERGEFQVHYQPQIDMNSGTIVGMEALVRWDHPQFGIIPPSRFIRWAEDSGLIIQLGEYVLREACRQNKIWQNEGLNRIRVAVNLSARQFKQDNLEQMISRALRDSSLDPDLLDLELTESVIMENPQTAIEISHRLRAMGIRFSIDDFGTGYSSLSYLKRLPVNSLKIDQSFVRDLASDESDKAIAKAVIALGHGLDLSVIAEGVETETQRDLLKEYKCDMVQGYLFSRALQATKFHELLKERKPFAEKTLFHAL